MSVESVEPAAAPATDGPYDVIVVGFGAAGACAALEAAASGASVLVLDRLYGGGASALSGGVVYAGGGTGQQRQAGVRDSPDAMLAYLRRETDGAVTDATIQRFVNASPDMLSWLEERGVRFSGTLCPYKTSYPTNRYHLYHSGNELAWKDAMPAAPRGHRAHSRNLSGQYFYRRLREAVVSAGVTVRLLCEADQLLLDNGRVVGVSYRTPEPGQVPGSAHRRLAAAAAKLQNWYPPVGTRLNGTVIRRARRAPVTVHAWAKGGVVLSGGGFAFNGEWVRRYAPLWSGLTPLGSVGDDGAVMRMGTEAGGGLRNMENCAGWRLLSPPSAFLGGILVNARGARFANEELYGSTLTKPLVEDQRGRAYLIVDSSLWRLARVQAIRQCATWQLPQLAYIFSPFGHRRARDLRGLAERIGVDPTGLLDTVRVHNQAIAENARDPMGKSAGTRRPLTDGPWIAVDCSMETSRLFPAPFMTLGGLAVDEETGAVLRTDHTAMPGVYAAGRSASGICSKSYVSGLALADAVFSGRRAGIHAAASAHNSPSLPAGGAS